MIAEQSVTDYYAQVEAEVEAETHTSDPICSRYRYITFVSKSKGRGRKRRHWEEIELVHDTYAHIITSWHKYPFDVYATEVLPYLPKDQVDKILMEHIRNHARHIGA